MDEGVYQGWHSGSLYTLYTTKYINSYSKDVKFLRRDQTLEDCTPDLYRQLGPKELIKW